MESRTDPLRIRPGAARTDPDVWTLDPTSSRAFHRDPLQERIEDLGRGAFRGPRVHLTPDPPGHAVRLGRRRRPAEHREGRVLGQECRAQIIALESNLVMRSLLTARVADHPAYLLRLRATRRKA